MFCAKMNDLHFVCEDSLKSMCVGEEEIHRRFAVSAVFECPIHSVRSHQCCVTVAQSDSLAYVLTLSPHGLVTTSAFCLGIKLV